MPFDSSDKLDEMGVASSGLTDVADTSDSFSADSGSAVSVLDSMQLDGLDSMTAGTVQMTSTPKSNYTSLQISVKSSLKTVMLG